MASPWRVQPITSPAFLDTSPALVQSSTTIKRADFVPAVAIAMFLLHCLKQHSQPCHSTTTHALAYSSATTTIAAFLPPVAIIKVFGPLSQNSVLYLQQLALQSFLREQQIPIE
ncbi:hypothetical protein O0I10_007040 [Lichtheimia ornata]|uniref:Uncharacterized protein n=1 Tax=Lichtheimia ornata TaxID=688661 RepID=A0AAD7V1T8_9FUNG|nr:uncharacterized protein O0I10_007040 [Lichtheimia ornata]KAJ8657224.1 hypothetical protein O0I10_007040 [Lichtheimia ornata]